MIYPLDLSFKVWSWSPKIRITDAEGTHVLSVHQKAFKLKEEITVFSDAEQTKPLYHIKADKWMDYASTYHFLDKTGIDEFGSLKREGMKSIWRAVYNITDNSSDLHSPAFQIREVNPWVKLADMLLGRIPLLSFISGYFFHPEYTLTNLETGTLVMKLRKMPDFLEGKFLIEQEGKLTKEQETLVLIGILTMILLERGRG